jgi:tRNA-5-taurinomethyluridine 2-sulfurtransferase
VTKTAMLISGGVDSSVALAMLNAQGGHDITAFYLKIWLEDELAFLGECPWEDDLSYVRAVCKQLDVPLEIIPLQSEYLERVVQVAIDELKKGRTPSPDLWCNERIKFGEFFNKVSPDYEKVASGHYAQTERHDGSTYLKCAPDPVKDQTYFLSRLSQDQLQKIMFPIGHLQKDEVRQKAIAFGLPNCDRKDSQGICFLGKIHYPDFVKFHLGEREGNIVDRATGDVLGTHDGFWFHTIGQRQGLGLSGGPWYVVGKDCDMNVVYVAHKDNTDDRSKIEFNISDVSWINEPPGAGEYEVKIRHTPSFNA